MRKAHWAIDKVTPDMSGRFAFNTAIAAVMELVNECYALRDRASAGALRFALATAALAALPVRAALRRRRLRAAHRRPRLGAAVARADAALLESDTFELVCQVNGKVRDRVEASATASPGRAEALCREQPNVQPHLDGQEVVKEIVVPGKLVNLVVR